MNVTLCSAFRNATGYLERYFEQLSALAIALLDRGDTLYCVWGEGDHTDETPHVLDTASRFYDSDIVTVNHGGADYGSVVNAERFANLAKVWNAIWARIPEDTDAVLFVESDLIWEPATMLALLDDLEHVPVVAPLVLLRRDGWPADYFYDVWAARKDGRHIGVMPPYFPGWDMKSPIQIDSMGSCLVMRGELARQLHWPPEDVIVGLSRQIYELGGSIWLHPELSVIHA